MPCGVGMILGALDDPAALDLISPAEDRHAILPTLSLSVIMTGKRLDDRTRFRRLSESLSLRTGKRLDEAVLRFPAKSHTSSVCATFRRKVYLQAQLCGLRKQWRETGPADRGWEENMAMMKVVRSIVITWISLGLLCGYNCVGAEESGIPAAAGQSPRDALLTAVIDAEVQATREYVALLRAKAALLQRMVQIEQTRLNASKVASAAAVNHTKSWHRPSLKHSNEKFDDWLAPQGTWRSPLRSEAVTPASLHTELISFRPNGNLGGKRNTGHSSRPGVLDSTGPVVQFLLVLDKQTGFLELRHPISQALLWHQLVEIPSPITRVAFHSERASHLLLVTQHGDLMVYKLRVFHGRRLVAGDYRRLSGNEHPMCFAKVDLPAGEYDSGRGVCPHNKHPFFANPTRRSIAPLGLHTHLEMDFEFTTKSPRKLSQITMVASHQSLVMLTSSEDGHLSFYDGHNGSFIEEINPGLGEMAHFQTLAARVVAFAAGNRVHFVDVLDRRLLGLTCEGSRHAITSLQRDVWRHTILYAGTSDDKGLAYRINRFASIKRNNGLVPIGADAMDPFDDSDLGFPTCTLTALLQPRARILGSRLHAKSAQRAAIVTALPGHVLVTTSDGHLVLYDTALHPGVPAYITEKYLATSLSFPFEIISVHAGKDPHAGTSAVAITIHHQPSRVRVELLGARLTPASSGLDIGWVRAPMMLFCAFGVMFWQQNRYRRAPLALSDFDSPNARRHRRQYGRGGHSDWPQAANHRAFSGM